MPTIELTHRQLVANCVLFFFAGHESTANQIGSGVYWLLKHPEQLAALKADPSLWPTARKAPKAVWVPPLIRSSPSCALR